MNLTIPKLSKGDKIAIVAPAKTIEKERVLYAKAFLEDKGFEVVIGEHCYGVHHYFSGTQQERLHDLQAALDDPEVKTILCARGGYGCVQLVDKIQWASMLRSPKWLIGFSDVTIFHSRLNILGIKSIHGTTPLNFAENTEASLETLLSALQEDQYSISCNHVAANKLGTVNGKLVGGNLSILYSLLGTNDQIDYTDTILFIEDLAEFLYVMDRIFYSFEKAGVFDKIKGLIIGGMTNIKDTTIPFGSTLEEIILSHFEYRKIPVAFGFPAGHISDNRALRFGEMVNLSVTEKQTQLDFLG
jgi:muramoyltetrapeptide carboxypeptidase